MRNFTEENGCLVYLCEGSYVCAIALVINGNPVVRTHSKHTELLGQFQREFHEEFYSIKYHYFC